MKYLIIVMALLTFNVQASIDPKEPKTERWECGTSKSGKQTKLVATIFGDYKTGKIQAMGITYKSEFNIKGFTRRWNFGLLGTGNYQYAFIIKMTGIGQYYDFGSQGLNRVDPSSTLFCKLVEPK